MLEDLGTIDKVNEKLLKRLQIAVVKKLIEKIEGDEGTSQDINTAVRLIQNYNIDLDTDKEEDEMTPEEQALLDEWSSELDEDEKQSSNFAPI